MKARAGSRIASKGVEEPSGAVLGDPGRLSRRLRRSAYTRTHSARKETTYLTSRAVWKISSSCWASCAGESPLGSFHRLRSLILSSISAMYCSETLAKRVQSGKMTYVVVPAEDNEQRARGRRSQHETVLRERVVPEQAPPGYLVPH